MGFAPAYPRLLPALPAWPGRGSSRAARREMKRMIDRFVETINRSKGGLRAKSLSLGAIVPNSSSTADAASYNTASWTPTNGDLYVFFVTNGRFFSGNASLPTCTGNSQTWDQITTKQLSSTDFRITAFRCEAASASTGVIAISFGGVTQEDCNWGMVHITGHVTGANGANAIVQSATNDIASGTSLSITLSAFADATNNVALGAFLRGSKSNITNEGGYTELYDFFNSDGFSGHDLEVEYIVGQDTSVSVSWTGSDEVGGIAMEIAAAAANVPSQPNFMAQIASHFMPW